MKVVQIGLDVDAYRSRRLMPGKVNPTRDTGRGDIQFSKTAYGPYTKDSIFLPTSLLSLFPFPLVTSPNPRAAPMNQGSLLQNKSHCF